MKLVCHLALFRDEQGVYRARARVGASTILTGPFATRDACLHDVSRRLSESVPPSSTQPSKETP